MRSNYKKLGPYIQEVNIRNTDLFIDRLLGVSIRKILIPSIANTIGTDMSKYKVVRENQFAYGPVTSRNGDKISIALLQEYDAAIISQSYKVFKIIDHDELLPEYLMMWFRRPEFDRYARFMSHGSTRETFDWEEMHEVELPIPHIDKQREIVKEYNTIVNRINLNEQLNKKLEETAQALYKHWFVDFNFPITKESYPELVSGSPDLEGKSYKLSGGNMIYNEELDKEIPEGWDNIILPELIEVKYGKDYKHLDKGNIPLYGSGGIMKYVNNFLYNKPSILIPRKGTLSNIMFIDEPFWSVDTMFYSKLRNENYGFYTYYYLKTLDFMALDVGSAVPSMTTEMLNSFQMTKPNIKILENFNSKLNILFRNSKERKLQIEKLKELASTILSKISTVAIPQTERTL